MMGTSGRVSGGGGEASGGPSASETTLAAAAVAPHGWLWRSDNPCRALLTPDAALTVCAWARGPCARIVVGSSMGWLAVVSLEGEEPDEHLVRTRGLSWRACG